MHAEFDRGLSPELLAALKPVDMETDDDGNVRKLLADRVDERHAAMLEMLAAREKSRATTVLHRAGERRVMNGSLYECDDEGRWVKCGGGP